MDPSRPRGLSQEAYPIGSFLGGDALGAALARQHREAAAGGEAVADDAEVESVLSALTDKLGATELKGAHRFSQRALQGCVGRFRNGQLQTAEEAVRVPPDKRVLLAARLTVARETRCRRRRYGRCTRPPRTSRAGWSLSAGCGWRHG